MTPTAPSLPPTPSKYAIGIIGAGFAGILAALRLQQSGRQDFIIFERATSIGGTWRENIYPGCACDVPSCVYSISDAPNPDWSRMYSPQTEILAYMQDIVREHALEAHIRYNSDVVQAIFDEASGSWTVMDQQGRLTHVKALIAALGPLNRPKWPVIPGIELFQGRAFHTAQWDASYDLKDKRVAVIGTGASAIQVVPAIAPVVAELVVFQRTAAWITPRNDHSISDTRKRWLRKLPGLQHLMRDLIFSIMEVRGRLFIGNQFIHKLATRQCLKKLLREVQDPILRAKLTPDYKLGCKRILSSDDYLPAFGRANVRLVTESIAAITPSGLITADGEVHDVDAIIFSTGFDAAEIQDDLKIIGRNGRDLLAEWAQNGMEAHHGTTFSGFPNLCYVLGPNTGLGHSSVLHVMESQMPYILQYLDLLDRQGQSGFLDVKPEAQAAFNLGLQAQFKGTVWESGCKSWYVNSKGKNTTLYPRLSRAFRRHMAKLDVENYLLG